jgi:hypothetical protein
MSTCRFTAPEYMTWKKVVDGPERLNVWCGGFEGGLPEGAEPSVKRWAETRNRGHESGGGKNKQVSTLEYDTKNHYIFYLFTCKKTKLLLWQGVSDVLYLSLDTRR